MKFKCIEELWLGQETDRENFYLNIEGDRHTFLEGTSFSASSASWTQGEKEYAFSEKDNLKDVIISNKTSGISVTQHYRFF